MPLCLDDGGTAAIPFEQHFYLILFIEYGFSVVTRNAADVLSRVRSFAEKRYARDIERLARALLPHIGRNKDTVLETTTQAGRDEAIVVTVIARLQPTESGIQWLVLTSDAKRVASIAATFERWLSARSGIRVARFGEAESATSEAKVASAAPHVVIATAHRLIDHIRRDNVGLDSVSGWIIDATEPATGLVVDLEFIATKLSGSQTTVVIGPPSALAVDLEPVLTRPTIVEERDWKTPTRSPAREPANEHPEERSMKGNELPFDEEQMAARLREIVKHIHEHEDPVELTQYKRFIKKHVGVFSRGYLSAYLLKNSMGDTGSRPSGRSRSQSRSQKDSQAGGGRRRSEKRDQKEQHEPSESGTHTSIFVSVGRNRRVKPADLTTLFTSADGIAEEDLGQIKVLDNFSFVEVANQKAGTAIDRLNGTEFRGRKLTVNYARKK